MHDAAKNKINTSDVKIDCCPGKNPPPPPPPPTPPPPCKENCNPPCKENCNPNNPCKENCGGGSPCRENCGGSAPCAENCGGSAGGPGGSVLGTTLPATGNNTFAGLTLTAFLMILLGIRVRNKGYQKPAYTLRFRYNTLHLA